MCKDEKRVYLYVFDIDEYGAEISIKENIYTERYLSLYALLFDRVVLQSSAFFKRHDLRYVFDGFPELFTAEYNKKYLISAYRGIGESGNEQYISSRYDALSKSGIKNAELNAYNEIDGIVGAKKFARQLDDKIDVKMVVKASLKTDTQFRKLAIEDSNNAMNLSKDRRQEYESYKYIKNVAECGSLFQTFYLKEVVKSKYNTSSIFRGELGHMLRKNYYRANALATGCFPIDDAHTNYNYILSFFNAFDLYEKVCRICFSKNAQSLINLKTDKRFIELKNLFFKLSGKDLYELSSAYNKGSKKKFYSSDCFKRFCSERGLEYKVYKYCASTLAKI